MASRSPAAIRNVVVCGHSTCGKTTLVESLLFKAGAVTRKGRIEEGTTVADYDPQEKLRKHSIDLACAHLDWKGVRVHLIDTPGYRDFIGQVYCGMSAVEAVVIAVDADEGVRPHTRKVWQIAESMGLPCFVSINRVDREQARLAEVLSQPKDQLSRAACPLVTPRAWGRRSRAVEPVSGTRRPSREAKEAAGDSSRRWWNRTTP